MGDNQRKPMVREEEHVQNMAKNDLFPLLHWMQNLTSLAVIKLGLFTNQEDDDRSVHPLLLQDLFQHVFSKERRPKSLQRLWIQQFMLYEFNFNLLGDAAELHDEPPPTLKSFSLQECVFRFDNEPMLPERRILSEIENVYHITREKLFDHVEHLAGHMTFPDVIDAGTGLATEPFLPNLKYVRVSSGNDHGGQVTMNFASFIWS